MEYHEFLEKKKINIKPCGFDIEKSQLNKHLFDWQKDIVKWALKKGRCALFEDCGLGKTIQQLAWADEVYKKTKGNVLILAPLAVSNQTKTEGEKFGISVNICESQEDVKNGINITNYEKLDKFNCDEFIGVVLDESSILKNSSGKIRTQIIKLFKDTKYKLACTATPAPNDFMELGNHSEFLGVMSQTEMLSTFFVHDGGDTSKWRLKGHAEVKFFEWIANWACVLQTPSDLGYEDEDKKYTLPEMNIIEEEVHVNDFETDNGQISLLPNQIQSLTERRTLRRESLKERVQKASEIANNIDGQVLIWCDMNAESELLTKSIKGAVEVKGTDKPEHKTKSMIDFKNGDIRVLVSKPSICGFGMNWQNCNNIIFVGLSDSFESYYQAVRRCWRFGQDKEVSVYIVISSAEGAVKANIERKQNNAQRMTSELVKFTKDILKTDISNTVRISEKYITNERMVLPKWIA